MESVETKGKKQKIECLKNEKSFVDEIKSTFQSLWRAIVWWKNKKILDTSFNNFNCYSAHLQNNENLKTHYNRLLSSWKWLETQKGLGTRPNEIKKELEMFVVSCAYISPSFTFILSLVQEKQKNVFSNLQ